MTPGRAFVRVQYAELNAKQKEIYNFQKVAGHLADYGFNCIKLADDWQGADFLAYHKDGTETLKVQLKARLMVAEAYQGKDLHMAFPHNGLWYLLPHDQLMSIVARETTYLTSASWSEYGNYSTASPSKKLLDALDRYRLNDVPTVPATGPASASD